MQQNRQYVGSRWCCIILMLFMLSQIGLAAYIIMNSLELHTSLLYSGFIIAYTRLLWMFFMILFDIDLVEAVYSEQYRNWQGSQLKLVIQMIIVDQNQIGNWLTGLLVVVQIIVSMFIPEDYLKKNRVLCLYLVIQNGFILLCSILIRAKYEEFPYYKMVSQRRVQNKTKLFSILVALLLGIQAGVYIIQIEMNDNIDSIVLCAASWLQVSVFLVIVAIGGIKSWRIKIGRISDQNRQCFNGWFTLFKSMINQMQYNCIRYIAMFSTLLWIGAALNYSQYNSIIDIYISVELVLQGTWVVDRVLHYGVQNLLLTCTSVNRQTIRYNNYADQYQLIELREVNQPSDAELVECVKMHELVECSICLQELDIGLMRLPCNIAHIFHKPCIEQWLQIHKNCPICRKSI